MQEYVHLVVEHWISQIVHLQNASMVHLDSTVELLAIILFIQVIFLAQVALYVAHTLNRQSMLVLEGAMHVHKVILANLISPCR